MDANIGKSITEIRFSQKRKFNILIYLPDRLFSQIRCNDGLELLLPSVRPLRVPEIPEVTLYAIDICCIVLAPDWHVNIHNVGGITGLTIFRLIGGYTDYGGYAIAPSPHH